MAVSSLRCQLTCLGTWRDEGTTCNVWFLIFADSTSSGDGMYGMMKGPGSMPGMPGVGVTSLFYYRS